MTRGEWRRLFGAVLIASELPITPSLMDRAAHLCVPGTVLAGPSAAPYHAIDVPWSRPCLVMGRRVHFTAGDIRQIVDRLDRRDVRLVEGVNVTSPERTIFDCALLLPDPAAVDLLERGLQRGQITTQAIVERTRQRVDRHGAPKLVRLVRKITTGTRSEGEQRLVALLRRAGLSGWAVSAAIHDTHGLAAIGDVVFAGARLVIEVDGFAFHVTPDRFSATVCGRTGWSQPVGSYSASPGTT